jgi:hypothetical protein
MSELHLHLKKSGGSWLLPYKSFLWSLLVCHINSISDSHSLPAYLILLELDRSQSLLMD